MQGGDAARSPTAAVEPGRAATAAGAGAGLGADAGFRADVPATSWATRLAAVAVVALTVSPIVLALASLTGARWYPVGDLSHILFRVGQVGTRQTPLVGAETIKGWAHPGPMEFWLAAPLYRLTGGDPRSLFFTAAAVNVTAISGIAAVAWRRGRFPLLVGSMLAVAVLVHALGPPTVVSIWNPFLPLVPFLLAIALTWDVALGHRRSVLWLAITLTVIAQVHFAFLTLSALLVVALVAWCAGWRGPVGRGLASPDGWAGGAPPAPPWGPWRRDLRRAAIVVGVLWLPVAFDAAFDLHNPYWIARSVGSLPPGVGPIDALGVVGRYVRPDGPWLGGPEPVTDLSVRGSGPLPLLLALAVSGGCLWVGWRRRLLDVVALAALALALVVGSLPATSQIYLPVYVYQTQFLKVVGVVVWVTPVWAAWRSAGPWLARRSGRRMVAGAVGGVALLGTVAWSWGDAADVTTPYPAVEQSVQAIRGQLDGRLPEDRTIRVEFVGDFFNIAGPGVIAWLIHDGYDVLTTDGDHGLKWGHDHRYQAGEHYDVRITVAVSHPDSFFDPIAECAERDDARLVAAYDPLSAEERAWIDGLRLERLVDPEGVTDADRDRRDILAAAGPRIGVFEGPRQCARPPEDT